MSQWITIIWHCARFCFPHFLANIYIDLDRNYFFHTNDNATNEKLLNEGLFEFKLFMCMMYCIFTVGRGDTGVQEQELHLHWLHLLRCKHPIHYYLCSGHRDLELDVAFVNTQNNLHKKYWKPVFSWEETSFVRDMDWCHQAACVRHLPVVGRHEKVGSALLAGAAILGADPEAVGDGAAVPRCG